MSLLENMQKEPVSRLALREPVKSTSDEPIRVAIEKMREKHLGCTIVVDEENRPAGLFTEAMLTELLAHNRTAVDSPIGQHMFRPCPCVKMTDPVADVLAALELKNLRFLAVVDESGRLAGLTGQKGLMEYVADHFPQQVIVQRIGGSPFPQEREGA